MRRTIFFCAFATVLGLLARPSTVVGRSLLPPVESLQTVTVPTVAGRIARAHDVILSAYVLAPTGAITRALEAAASRGARVHVVLDGAAFGRVVAMNERSASALRAAGARVEFTRGPLHAKAAVVDRHLYLTDRNWTHSRAEVVIEDRTPGDEAIVLRAITGVASDAHGRLTTRKRDSLDAEAALLANPASHDVGVETESFGGTTSVARALLARRHRGDRVRLLVDRREYGSTPSERDELNDLSRQGVEIRVGRSGEKLATDGAHAWVGSTNATPGVPDQVDWGITATPEIAATIAEHFARNWDAATPP